MGALTRGEVAKLAGVNTETLRYYERRGLIPEPSRSTSNYRLYPKSIVQRIHLIKRFQEVGFSLDDIQDMLFLWESSEIPSHECSDVCRKAYLKITSKMEEVSKKRSILLEIQNMLSQMINHCSDTDHREQCPILVDLETTENDS